jgi:hypothetical protein
MIRSTASGWTARAKGRSKAWRVNRTALHCIPQLIQIGGDGGVEFGDFGLLLARYAVL